MLTARFQPRLQAASYRKARPGRTAVLKVVAFKNGDEDQPQQQQELSRAKVTFQLPLHVEWGQEVAVVGAADSLGNWDVEQCIPMAWNDGDVWVAQAELPTNTSIEYKYIIRAGEGVVKGVVEWQPCNNMELQAGQPELTIRDAWEGQQHDVLPGTLPLPPPPAPEPQATEAPTETPFSTAEAVAPEAQLEAAAASEEAVKPIEPEAAASVVVVAPAVVAEEADAPAAPAAAAAKSESRKPESPAEAVAAAASGTSPVARSNAAGRRSTSSRGANGSKPTGGNSTRSKIVAAGATEAPNAPAVKYGSLSTTELREVCQERGVSSKGQRKDLLARLQQLLQGRQA